MKKLIAVALVLGGLLTGGCAPKGYIRVDGIAGLVSSVCARHDAYVSADPTYADKPGGEDRRASDLDSSRILKLAISEAQKAESSDASK